MILAEVDWNSLLQSVFRSPFSIAILGVLGGTVIALGGIWSSARTTRTKEKMIERGFTAAEIEQVMNAGKK